MTDILYLVLGTTIGLAAGGVIVFMLPYRSLQRSHARVRAELADEQAKNNELQGAILNQQSTAYQVRQTLLLEQKRLEGDLTQVGEHRASLEQQYAELKARYEREQQNHLQETARLRDSITRTEQERAGLQKQFAHERVEWDRQIQSLLLQNTQIEDQMRALQRDKAMVDARLEEQHEEWERERLALQIQINTLEDSLTLYKARSGQNLSPDSAQMMEQLRAEAVAESNRRRAAWEKERKSLQEQLERLQTELRAAQEPANPDMPLQPPQWEQEKRNLLQQLEQAHQVRRNLEEKMAARDRQAEQERSALEAEIEQLMERFLRLHHERNG